MLVLAVQLLWYVQGRTVTCNLVLENVQGSKSQTELSTEIYTVNINWPQNRLSSFNLISCCYLQKSLPLDPDKEWQTMQQN